MNHMTLLDWYRELRRFWPAKQAYTIAKRMPKFSCPRTAWFDEISAENRDFILTSAWIQGRSRSQ